MIQALDYNNDSVFLLKGQKKTTLNFQANGQKQYDVLISKVLSHLREKKNKFTKAMSFAQKHIRVIEVSRKRVKTTLQTCNILQGYGKMVFKRQPDLTHFR